MYNVDKRTAVFIILPDFYMLQKQHLLTTLSHYIRTIHCTTSAGNCAQQFVPVCLVISKPAALCSPCMASRPKPAALCDTPHVQAF